MHPCGVPRAAEISRDPPTIAGVSLGTFSGKSWSDPRMSAPFGWQSPWILKPTSPGSDQDNVRLRTTTAIVSTLALVVALGTPAFASGADTSTTTAGPSLRDQVAFARAKAEDAAQRMSDAETQLAETTDRLEATKVETRSARDDLTRRRGDLRDFSVEAYMGSSETDDLQPTVTNANDIARAEVLARAATEEVSNGIDEVRAAQTALEAAEVALAEQQASATAARDTITAESQVLQSELGRLETLERQEREEAARRAREEAARARAEEEARRRASTTTTTPRVPVTAPPTPGAPPTTRPPATPPTTPPTTPPPTPPPTPPTTTPPPPAPPGGGWSVAANWLCPIAGTTTFVDTWGAARSGGRTHQGTDMFAARGTPVVASVSGRVQQRNGGLGGLAYFLYGDDGHTYYGAHLDTLTASGQVSRGTVIGTVGDTGNAAGGATHLHFEIHPNRGAPQNPFAVLRSRC